MSIVITYPYPLGKRITEEKLIRCGREKFLEKGYAEANERQIMEYICAHRQECELVLEKCSGSKYESFRDVVFNNMFTAFQGYYEKQLGYVPDKELLRILTSMRLHGFLELIKGDYDMEHRLFLTKAIGIHADAGTQSLITYFKSKKDAHR